LPDARRPTLAPCRSDEKTLAEKGIAGTFPAGFNMTGVLVPDARCRLQRDLEVIPTGEASEWKSLRLGRTGFHYQIRRLSGIPVKYCQAGPGGCGVGHGEFEPCVVGVVGNLDVELGCRHFRDRATEAAEEPVRTVDGEVAG